MSINNLENAAVYSEELDRLFTQKSATGFLADNAFGARFVGAKTVIVPDIDFSGLADYDRDTGFTRGAITVSNTSYTMQMDRARSLQIDREDLDETGVANLAGKILGEYVRTKVVPECDAYVLSKLSGLAATRGNTIKGENEKPYAALCELINNVQEKVGYDTELVAFIDSCMYARLMNTDEISKMITVSDFKQGEIDLKVNTLNGVALIPVVSERMKTAYNFKTGTAGGFVPADNAKEVYMLVCAKDGAHLMKKTEKMRIFTPDQNPDADAFKFDYRIYYDVFVKKSGLDAVWAWISPEVSITSQPTDVSVTEGNITGKLSVTASASDSVLTYQWYACDENGENAVKVAGQTSASMNIPTDLTEGEHYFYAVITVDGLAKYNTSIAKVTVA
ncbi:MAG: hypothetical protein U0M42_09330 [Acutalibacteraceae bacterium]|nr:hypothetical protein [Acutalibacteraceae bacterium]